MSNHDDDNERGNGGGCLTWLIVILLIWMALATGGAELVNDVNISTGSYSDHTAPRVRVYTGYPTAVHPDGWYSNPANFEHRQPTPTPALLSGVHHDQFGQRVEIHPGNVTMRQRDANGGEFLEINGVRYFRTATGELFRTGQ